MFLLSNCSLDIDPMIPGFTSKLISIIKIGIPVILIFFGILDLGKSVMAKEEKEMKENQAKFIKRCIYAILVFFVVSIVSFLFSTLAKASNKSDNSINDKDVSACINCFINGDNCKN